MPPVAGVPVGKQPQVKAFIGLQATTPFTSRPHQLAVEPPVAHAWHLLPQPLQFVASFVMFTHPTIGS